MRNQCLVRDYMAADPHAVGLARSLARARRLMRELQVHHLTVLESGTLLGVICERTIEIVSALEVGSGRMTVDEAMSPHPLVVAPNTPLVRVVHAVAAQRDACAVVMDGDRVCGIFTTC